MFILVFDKFLVNCNSYYYFINNNSLICCDGFKKRCCLRKIPSRYCKYNYKFSISNWSRVAILHILDFDLQYVLAYKFLISSMNKLVVLASIVTIIVSFGLFNLIKSAMGQVVSVKVLLKRRQTIYKVTISFSRYILYIVVIAILLGVGVLILHQYLQFRNCWTCDWSWSPTLNY